MNSITKRFLIFVLILLHSFPFFFLLNAKRHSTAKCRESYSSQAGQEREKTTHGSAQRREADEEVARRVEGAREPVAKVVKNGEKTTRER